MREIGGYFGLEELIEKEYYKDLVGLNTGRNALLYLLRSKDIKKVYLPYYLCGSVSETLRKYGYGFEYYHIDIGLDPVFEKRMREGEILYIVNYYGQLSDSKVLSLKEKYGQIVLDNTQAFFQKPIRGIDTLYSCRKFFGVPDGAYLSTNVFLSEKLECDVSKERMRHILGRYEGKASDYYPLFQENDASLKNVPLRYMSKLTHNILGAIDYERVRISRNDNYAYLERKLAGIRKRKTISPDGPFAYPLYVDKGMEIRKKMAEKNIYIPLLWPNVLKDDPMESVEYQLAVDLLPLPCDQRYGTEDMQFMSEELLKTVEDSYNEASAGEKVE